MKRFTYLFAILLTCTSCSSTFFYSSLNTSNDYVEKVENGDFLLETDSLWIAYCFKGNGAPIQITVFNKLDVPLYVDWGKSALIINDMAMTYAGKEMKYSEEWYEYGRDISVSSADNITFIPPNTMISETPLYLSPNFEHINKKAYRKSRMGTHYKESVTVQRIDYIEEDSPLKFKSYLTIYAQPEKPMTFKQDFYIANIIKATGLKPAELAGNMAERGDFLYVEKPANNTALYTTLTVVTVTGLAVVGLLYGDPNNNDYDYDDDY